MEVEYKKLSDSDVSLLKQLLAVFGEAFEEPRTFRSAVPSDAYLRSLLGKRYFIVVVASFGGEVIGGLAA